MLKKNVLVFENKVFESLKYYICITEEFVESLKRGFGGCGHGFSKCDEFGGFAGRFGGLDGFGGFDEFTEVDG